jgi:uncharacterized YccA/Bax inhibitor family protein
VYGARRSTTMTVEGTVGKTSVLLAVLAATAIWSWNATAAGQLAFGVLLGSLLGAVVVAIITISRPTAAPWSAPIYAALEGIFLGSFSQMIDVRYGVTVRGVALNGIALQAIGLTCGVMFVMLFVYATRLIRVTDKLRAAIVMATGALCMFYLVAVVLQFFGVMMPLVFSSSIYGVGFSLFVVGLAAFNLLLDFDFIEHCVRSGAPKYMEWYGAFGLMVTLVWLYLEILRLLRKLADQRD